jgi:hypothetical protein
MSASPGATLTEEMSPDHRITDIAEMASLGVEWMQLIVPKDSLSECLDSLADFVSNVAHKVE